MLNPYSSPYRLGPYVSLGFRVKGFRGLGFRTDLLVRSTFGNAGTSA